MNIDIIKTSNDDGAVFIKYQLHTRPPGPTYEITLPFVKNKEGLLDFKITEETLRDLVRLITQKVR